jgi:hypothetical protein
LKASRKDAGGFVGFRYPQDSAGVASIPAMRAVGLQSTRTPVDNRRRPIDRGDPA